MMKMIDYRVDYLFNSIGLDDSFCFNISTLDLDAHMKFLI